MSKTANSFDLLIKEMPYLLSCTRLCIAGSSLQRFTFCLQAHFVVYVTFVVFAHTLHQSLLVTCNMSPKKAIIKITFKVA